jgi:DNA-binding transcriptional regulator YdaS (Cro superfamily)
MLEALLEAIKIAGSQKDFAADLGIRPPSVTGWILRKKTPANRVLEVEARTGISKHRLRPDIYPPPIKSGK